MYNLLVWLNSIKGILVSDYNEFEGIVTVILMNSADLSSFNKWNESNGINYSMARIKNDVVIIYPNNNDGVLITDLTGEN